jgi:two-component system, NtrC family, response regulator
MAKILIVDDDPNSFSLFRAICRTKGYEATVAENLKDGLREAVENSYDLIMLDVHLPDGNGLEALPKFRAAGSSPVVIILTALGDPNGAELAINSGAWDYLAKPVSLQEVSLSLTRALEHRQMEQSNRKTLLLKRDEFAGSSPKLLHCLELVAHAAGSDMNALIYGETGTGKEVLASLIHKNSARAGKPFVVVDCSSLPANLVESALFGHVKGAFTGAVEDQVGLIKKADGGTLFLDEVGELPQPMQKNLLRVLQERIFRPVGSSREVSSNFRLIAATNRNLDQMVGQGTFREDLLFRLKTMHIALPPLRERKEDIHTLIIHFMNSLNDRYGHGIKGISPDLLEAVQTYTWPGNVRELKSAVEYAYLTAASGPTLLANHLPPNIRIHLKKESLTENSVNLDTHSFCFTMPLSLDQLWDQIQRQYLQILVSRSGGKIQEAIQISQLSKSRLYALLKKHDLVFGDK